MHKVTVKFDQKAIEEVYSLRKNIALVVAGLVVDEFHELLKDSPQRSGNFVANMAIAAGTSMGRKGGELVFPIVTDPEAMMQRGSIPAIHYAMEQNKNLAENVTRSISRKAGWCPAITIYNRLAYARVVEGYTEEQLRDVNREGAHPIMKARARMAIRTNKTIKYKSPEWYYLLGMAQDL